jgi:penicillin amidase
MRTRRGPVIDTDRRTGEALALRTPGMVESDLGFAALLPLLRSRTADEVVAALAHWVEPVNSVLVADRTGAMRRTVAGLVPLRDDATRRQPVPAWEPGHAWTGYAHLPTAVLTAGYVAANDRRPGDTADLGIDFAPPDRARRIVELIGRSAAPERVQCDVHADVDWMRGLLARAAAPDERAERVRRRLLRWDGAMRADSLDAGLFAAWRSAFARRLCRDPALARLTGAASPFDPLFAPWLTAPVRVGRSVARLAGGGPRLGIDTRRLAAQALLDVAGQQERPWGATHVLEPLVVGTDAATVSGRTGTRSPVDGDTDCVLASGSIPGLDDACRRGPVARYVWDLGERGRSRWIVPFGAAGRPGDPHRVDQHARWLAGELIPVGPPRPWRTAPEPEPPRQEVAAQ